MRPLEPKLSPALREMRAVRKRKEARTPVCVSKKDRSQPHPLPGDLSVTCWRRAPPSTKPTSSSLEWDSCLISAKTTQKQALASFLPKARSHPPLPCAWGPRGTAQTRMNSPCGQRFVWLASPGWKVPGQCCCGVLALNVLDLPLGSRLPPPRGLRPLLGAPPQSVCGLRSPNCYSPLSLPASRSSV